jgi:GNAT superfamily N-acetyltransferase
LRLLAEYLKEREGFDSIVRDEGFATYRINGDECYIRDIYVHPDYRNKDIASDMADEICVRAAGRGCLYLTGSVDTRLKSATASTKVLLAYGFKIHRAIEGGIFFRKDLK